MIRIIKEDPGVLETWKLEIEGKIDQTVSFKSSRYKTYSGVKMEIYYDETSPVVLEQNISDLLSSLESPFPEISVTKFAEKLLKKEIEELCMDNIEGGDSFLNMNLSFSIHEQKVLKVGIESLAFVFNIWWKRSFSLEEYLHFVNKDIYNSIKTYKTENDTPLNEIVFTLTNKELTVMEAIEQSVTEFKLSHKKAFENLSEHFGTNTLTTRFSSFPEELRIPCEQYLIYFTEFLRDLGVNATSDIKHEAGEILFSVTPSDPNQALDKIKLALEAFLNLPKSEINIISDEEFEVAMLKVKANVDHLNSQLSLAKAEIKVKERELQAFEATLETKDISIEFLQEKLNQQKHLLNGEISEAIIDVNPKVKVEDKEEFLNGIFALTKFE